MMTLLPSKKETMEIVRKANSSSISARIRRECEQADYLRLYREMAGQDRGQAAVVSR
jgi:hypothetical protein